MRMTIGNTAYARGGAATMVTYAAEAEDCAKVNDPTGDYEYSLRLYLTVVKTV